MKRHFLLRFVFHARVSTSLRGKGQNAGRDFDCGGVGPCPSTALLLFLLLSAILLLASCADDAGEQELQGGGRGDGRTESSAEAESTSRDGSNGFESKAAGGEQRFTIAEQYGLAYAPLQIMRSRKMLEKRLAEEGIENTEISWRRLGNTAAIREAILGGRVDAGFMGIPPFLIGFDRGMEWKMVSGLSKAPLGLVTWREELRSLSDFAGSDRIALPQPGSIQHILLSMACERELGEAGALDGNLVTMNHPDGMQALLAKGDISAHFTSPPYIMEELSREGMRLLLSGREAMGGEFTFIVGALTVEALQEMPELSELFVAVVREAAIWTEEHPEEASRILSDEYEMDQAKLYDYLLDEELVYGPEIHGIEEFIDFMHRHGYLNERLEVEEVLRR